MFDRKLLQKSFFILLILWISGFCFYLYRIYHYKIDPSIAQGIVILTGGKERIRQGVFLLEKNPKTPLLITGVLTIRHLNEVSLFPEHKDQIDLGFKATSTKENAKEILEWNRIKKCASLTVVTSHYHMPRSLLELSYALPNVILKPYPIIAHPFKELRWLFRPKLWHLLLKEYSKYLIVLVEMKVKSLL